MHHTPQKRIILGIDPGLAHTGWGVVAQQGARLACMAYGCIETRSSQQLPDRLFKIYSQISAVVARYQPSCVSIETVWFGTNTTSAFATGQARGAALAACASTVAHFGEYSPKQIKLAIVGTGSADKTQVEYMVQHLLGLESKPEPDHAADALAAAICFANYDLASFGKADAL